MNKLLSFNTIQDSIKKIKGQGNLVLTGGCFDILHTGHIAFLKQAKKQGDVLMVMLEGDESIQKRKGIDRPINTQEKRASILASVPEVDYILPLPYLRTDLEYYNLVKTIEPDIIAVTVGDPALSKKIEQAKMVKGKVVEIKKIPEYSTTNLLKK